MRWLPQFHDDAEAGHREHAPPLRPRSARCGAGDLIRDAVRADCAALAALHAAAFNPGWSATAIAGLLDIGATALIDEGRGFILVRTAADEAEVLTLAVAPPARRAGVGRALVDAAVERVRGQGASVLHLEFSTANAAAALLYGAAGFRETGRRRRYYADGTDAVLLARAIA